MVKNYLKVALRSLLKNRIFSFINISGLALGIAASLLILQYVNYELSYEDFNSNKERVFRLKTNRYEKGALSTEWAAGVVSIGHLLNENLADVEAYARLTQTSGVFSIGDIEFKESRVYFANPDVFRVFDTQLIYGDEETALNEPASIAISKSLAQKYFGKDNAVGETMYFNKNRPVKITAVFEDVPQNSHFKYDILASWSTVAQGDWAVQANQVWYWDGYFNYVLLKEGVDAEAFAQKVDDFVESQWGDEMRESETWMDFDIQPLQDIHLYSNYMMEAEVNGDGDAVYALLFISFFIIIIAWVNYINLATAKSMERAKEVGMRKVLGSQKGQLIRQFLTESVMVNLLAVILAFVIILTVLPAFANLAEQPLTFELFTKQGFWLGLSALFVAGTVLSGIYPAFVLSSFKPVQTLKGSFVSSSKGGLLRKGLVIFQFIASMALIIGTYTVYEQISFMRNQNLGVDIDQTLVLSGPSVLDSTYQEKLSAFKDVMKANSNVENVVVSTGIPGRAIDWNAGGIRLESAPETDGKQYRVIGVGYEFLETFDLNILAGRSFSKGFGNEESNIVFSESAVKQLGFNDYEEALGERINFWGEVYTIIGVLEDYHHVSLKEDYDQLIFRMIPDASNYYSVKFNATNTRAVVGLAQEQWSQFFPGNPFEYFFLDNVFNEQYKADQKFGTVFTIFSGLAIFVACMGLFGLASFMVSKRTKEIGIRKVLGASVSSILSHLSVDFLKPIVLAIVIAIPIAYYAMEQWLSGFAFRIGMSWYIFLLPALLVMLIALVTVSIQTTSAAKANPVKSLRYE